MKTYDYFLYVVSSLPQSVCVGYVDNTLPFVAMHHMILCARRKFFEITTKPNIHVAIATAFASDSGGGCRGGTAASAGA